MNICRLFPSIQQGGKHWEVEEGQKGGFRDQPCMWHMSLLFMFCSPQFSHYGPTQLQRGMENLVSWVCRIYYEIFFATRGIWFNEYFHMFIGISNLCRLIYAIIPNCHNRNINGKLNSWIWLTINNFKPCTRINIHHSFIYQGFIWESRKKIARGGAGQKVKPAD